MIYTIFFLVTILISVAFFTLLERKILGYTHFRVGPNKNIILGVGQPFSDLIKLFSKMDYNFSMSNIIFFTFSPMFMVIFAMVIWLTFYHGGNSNSLKFFFLALMTINGLLTFFFLFPGWSSGSLYSSLGGYRSSAQCISYESIFFFCLIIMILMFFSFNMVFSVNSSYLMSNLLVLFPLLPIWMMAVMAESNRTPFDFSEGESELVSGFNTEYGSGLFSIIFLSEYMSMLFYSFFTSVAFFSTNSLILIGLFFFLLFYVWVRTSFPRLRYDKLMSMSWKSLMFLITSLLFLYTIMFFF